jgi:hypothetical protein
MSIKLINMVEDEAVHVVKCRGVVLHDKARVIKPQRPKTPLVIQLGSAELAMASIDGSVVVGEDVEARSKALALFALATTPEAADRVALECANGAERLKEINEMARKDGKPEEVMPIIHVVTPGAARAVDRLFEAVDIKECKGERDGCGLVVALQCPLGTVMVLGDYATVEALRYPVRRAMFFLTQWYRHAHPHFINHGTLVLAYDLDETDTAFTFYIRLVRPTKLHKTQLKHVVKLADSAGDGPQESADASEQEKTAQHEDKS